jgi:hypothetical protein
MNVCSHYLEIEPDQVKKLLDDRIEFKLWAALRHFDKLEKIERSFMAELWVKTEFMQKMNWIVTLHK